MTRPQFFSDSARRTYRGILGNAPIALWAVPVADLGGVARHVLDVARTGIPDTRLVVLCPPGPLATALRDIGIPVLVEGFGPEAGLRSSVRSLRHAVAKLRPAVLHTHLAYADLVAALAVPISWPVRLISTEHGIAAPGTDVVYHGSGAKSAFMHAVHAARCERFDALIAVSEATAAAMRATWHPRREIRVVYNGVNPLAHLAPTTGLRILSLARLAPEKRITELLKAFSVLHRDHPEACLTIAGTGPLEEELRATVAVLGLEEAVDMPGFVDAEQALAEHDVLAQLSVWENCSYSLLDAVAHGKGVVATPVGGNPELLPPQSLVGAEDLQGLASVLYTQGMDLQARPQLGHWLSLPEMTVEIQDVYRGCFA
nr:glycosyltransferase family 4 protein [Actinomyces sp.]